MSFAFDLKRFIISPGRKLIGILGKMKIDMESAPKFTSTIAKHNAVLRHFSTSAADGGEYETLCIAFLDITDSKSTPEELVEELNKSGYFRVLKVIRPITDGLMVDTASYPLKVGTKRAAILTDAEYRGLLTEVRKLFGSGGDTLLYHVGYHMGMRLGRMQEEIAERVGIKDPKKIYKEITTAMFQLSGYGRMEVLEMENDRAVIQVYDSFECELGKGRVIPYSHLVRGIIAGTLSEIFEKGFVVVEDACIAKGDPACKFDAWVKI